MKSVQELANRVLGGLAFWVMLVGWAVAQDGRQCPQPSFAVPEECWPPPCRVSSCDTCDEAKSSCPGRDDLFLVPPRPILYVTADGGAIRRNPTHRINFASLNDPGNIALSTGNFNYDFSAAGRLIVGGTLNDCLQIESVYTGVAEAADTAAVRDSTPNVGGLGHLFSPFGGFGASPIVGLDYNNLAQIHYTSSLQIVELNIRRQVPVPPGRLTASVLFGVRYISLPEDFDYATQSILGSAAIHVATNNQMVGPQIGAMFEMYVDNRWWVNFEMKGAVMNNRAQQTTSGAINYIGAVVPLSGSECENHTSFAGDLALTFVYRWSPHFTTRLGYQALWLTNMALAPDNLNTNINILTQGPAQLNHGSQTVYHGPFAGVELGW
jgi:hypothetical protein